MNLSEKAELTLFQQWAIKYTDKNKIYMSLVQVSTIIKLTCLTELIATAIIALFLENN